MGKDKSAKKAKKDENYRNVLIGIILSLRFLINSKTIEGILIVGGYLLVGLFVINHFRSLILTRYIPSIFFSVLLLEFFIFYLIIGKNSDFKLWEGLQNYVKSNLLIFILLLFTLIFSIITILVMPLTTDIMNSIIATFLAILTIAFFRLLQDINKLNYKDFLAYAIKLLDESFKKWDSVKELNTNEKLKLFWAINLSFRELKKSTGRWLDNEFIRQIHLLSFLKLPSSIAMLRSNDKKALKKIQKILQSFVEISIFKNPKNFKNLIENEVKEVALMTGVEDISVDVDKKDSLFYQLKKYILPIIFIFNAILVVIRIL